MIFLKKISKIIFLLFVIWNPFLLYSEDEVTVSKLRISSIQGGLRVIIDADQSPAYEVFSLKNPNRLVVDLAKTNFSEDFSFPATKGFIKGIRFGSFNNDVSRIVFDLNSSVKKIKSRVRKPSSGSKRTLNIDIENYINIRTLNEKNKKLYNSVLIWRLWTHKLFKVDNGIKKIRKKIILFLWLRMLREIVDKKTIKKIRIGDNNLKKNIFSA